MRQGQALLVGLLTGLLVGCATQEPVRSTSWVNRLRILQGPVGPNIVQMDVALLERPLDDPYINQELWAAADEQVVALEQKAKLEDNGLRVCQIGGITPARLQALLTSERSGANPNPHRLQLRAGSPTTLALGPPIAHCRFQLPQEDQPIAIALDEAECVLQVVPTLTEEGPIRLRFTPQIRHGVALPEAVPTPDRSGYVLQHQRPIESFAALSWEVTLAPNEYVVVGGRADRPQTLGHQCFVRRDEPLPVQRLLVIRTCRQAPGLASDSGLGGSEEEPTPSKVPTLALQAAWASARAGTP